MATKCTFYEIPGQFEFDDMRFGNGKSPECLTRIREKMMLKETDVVSVGLPKTGTTRTNEIVFQILKRADEEIISSTPAHKKLVYVESNIPGKASGLDQLENMPSPRLIRSHLPMRYFERQIRADGPKIVVTVRNPKDTLVSTYHFYRMNKLLGQYQGTWDEFFDMYKNEKITHEDYMKYYAGWMKKADHPNVLIIKFEDIKKDASAEICKIAQFLNVDLSPKQIQTIVRLTSFEQMENAKQQLANPWGAFNENISKFFRKGDVGDWKNYMSDEQSNVIDKQYMTILQPLGLELRFQ